MIRGLRHFWFGTLRGRLILTVAAVHTVLMTLFVIDSTVRQSRLMLDSQEREATALSQSLATSAANWILANDVAGLQKLVEAERRYPEIAFAVLTDDHGRVLADTDPGRVGRYLQDLPRTNRRTVLSRSPTLVDVAVPVSLGDMQVGWARIGLGQRAARTDLTQLVVTGVLYALAAIVFGSLIAWRIGFMFTQRLDAVQDAIGQVRRGARTARCRVGGTDEAASIAHDFNTLLDSLGERDEAVRRSEARYRFLLENIQAAVVVHDAGTRVLISNPMARELLGVSEPEMPGRTAVDPRWHFLREDGSVLPVEEYPVNRALAAGEPVRNLTLGVERPGETEPVWVLASADPRRDEEGTIVEVIVTFVDITQRKCAERRIQQLNQELEGRVLQRTRELEAANTELGAFAYTVSHDLRAPLRHIGSFLELLQERLGSTADEPSRHYMSTIMVAVVRMGLLIDDLLSFSRMGRQNLSHRPMDLKRLAVDVIEELEPEMRGRDVRWTVGCLPEVTGDQTMLRMVLVNLLCNALKFTQPRARAEIEIGARRETDEDVVFVRDNGVGFDMQFADKLFGVFQRLHGAEEFEGTGIGLATVRRVIIRHGGRTWAEGTVDGGATFYFSLPRG